MSVADIPGMGCYFFSYEWIENEEMIVAVNAIYAIA